jgi:hypothetical protein
MLSSPVPNLDYFDPLFAFVDNEVDVTLRFLEEHALEIGTL